MVNSSTQSSSALTLCDELIFVSSRFAESGSDSLGEEIHSIVGSIAEVMTDAGAQLADLVHLRVYYLNDAGLDEAHILRLLASHFQTPLPPAITLLPLRHLARPQAHVQIEAIGVQPGSKRSLGRVVSDSDRLGSHPFSTAVRCDDLVFVSAQMSRNPAGETLFVHDIVNQAKVTIANITAALEAVGAAIDDVVKLNTFYVGNGTTSDWTQAAEIRSAAFVKPGPGATGVPVAGPYPDDVLVRQDCIAVIGSHGRLVARETSWPESVWDWPIPVSFQQGLKLGNLLVLGGQISANRAGEAVYPNDMAAQTVYTMQTIDAILAGFGAGVDDLAKLTVLYATQGDPEDLPRILALIEPFFSNGLPAFTAIALDKLGLDGVLIEIEGIGQMPASHA